LLPTGRLREPLGALRRADAVVLFDSQAQAIEAKRIWHAARKIELPVAARKTIAFSGIARPQQFLAGLQSSRLEIAGALTFRDHHRYQQRDIDRLLQFKKQTGVDGFITTEKDLINLGPLASQLPPLLTAGLRIEIESAEQVVIEMIKTIEQRSGQQI
jgi:tetraacyldisaccharide 4'-kinase